MILRHTSQYDNGSKSAYWKHYVDAAQCSQFKRDELVIINNDLWLIIGIEIVRGNGKKSNYWTSQYTVTPASGKFAGIRKATISEAMLLWHSPKKFAFEHYFDTPKQFGYDTSGGYDERKK